MVSQAASRFASSSPSGVRWLAARGIHDSSARPLLSGPLAVPPTHLLLGPPRHGVRVVARQLAETVHAPRTESWADSAGRSSVHLHLNETLIRHDDGLAALARLAERTRVTVTLHDLPQASDGPAFERRCVTYRRVLRLVHGWAVSSEHERELVHEHLQPPGEGLVAPLPVIRPAAARGGPLVEDLTRAPTAAVLGFVYPDKGHRELIAAAAELGPDHAPHVLALGTPAPGHDELVGVLATQAREAGVRFTVTGYLDEATKAALLARVSVAVCGHRNVSASGSTNEWLAAGRRPLLREGRYAREMAALRPGTVALYDDAGLPAALADALEHPASTRLAHGTDTRPHLADTAAAYLAWWRSR